ncbi:hypothetical protein JHK85_013989 [Glycine max]|uniref:Uncharacterized protein n=2 Tax=Glycine max TaxID=3847 RepID=A0A0R0JZE5_SOYBN|nr:hypothetical protein JHK85_013989 [Glycine max]KAG5058636.1 hypothetical protein JHK86_013632 [Glycine max]
MAFSSVLFCLSHAYATHNTTQFSASSAFFFFSLSLSSLRTQEREGERESIDAAREVEEDGGWCSQTIVRIRSCGVACHSHSSSLYARRCSGSIRSPCTCPY